MQRRTTALVAVLIATLSLAAVAAAQEVVFKDPTGDDNGPGAYIYPTDAVYKPGSFDLVGAKIKVAKDNVDFAVDVNAKLEDPWGMGGGFAGQMIFIFIDTDGKEGSGFTQTLPGLNVEFAPAGAWDRCVVLSPQGPGRVKSEVDAKLTAEMKGAVLVPSRTRGANRTISGSVPLKDLGGGDPSTWGYQIVVQSNEGFPEGNDLLTRKVNEYEGQHRFGGGNDAECDPHVIDCLAGAGVGDKSEIEAQHEMLAFECKEDGTAAKVATLAMVRAAK